MSEIVEAARFSSSVEADLARTYLESYGLSSVLFDAEMQSCLIGPIAVRLMVVDKDLPEARKLLQQYFKEGERSG